MNTEHDLTTHLSREAERFDRLGGSPLDLSQVLDRAGEIKRGRRMRATMVMAAVVLAVAVPTTLVATNGADQVDRPVPPSHQPKADNSSLSLDGLERGAPPRNGYALDGGFHVGKATVPLGAGADVVARVEGGLMVAARKGGALTARFVDDGGGSTGQTWTMEGSFAVSPGGNVAAFVGPGGDVWAVQDGGSRYFELGWIPRGSGFTAVAVQGENCSGRSEETGCKVYATTSGEQPETWVTAPGDKEARVVDTGLIKTFDVAEDGRVAGMLSATDTGSCSEVVDGLEPLWKTCDQLLGSFSPDSDLVLAGPAYGDAAGDSTLTVLDAATGETVLHLECVEGDFVADTTWEDSTHVLTEVHQDGTWAIVRVALNGTREIAAGPVVGDDPYVSPYALPSR